MGHQIEALLFRSKMAPATPTDMAHAQWCALPQDVWALPLTEELKEALLRDEAGQRDDDIDIFDVSGGLHPALDELRRTVSGGRCFAYIQTEYFAGIGDQTACVWQDGHAPLVGLSINEALARLGVEAHGASDLFEALFLDVMRVSENFSEGLEARIYRIFGERLVGRYASASGIIDLRGEPPHIGTYEGERMDPWRILPNRRFAVGAPLTHREFSVDYERGGTPRLVGHPDGTVWHYNDGPQLVHESLRPHWESWARPYRCQKDGRVQPLILQKGHLYWAERRLVEQNDAQFITTDGKHLALQTGRLDVDGETWFSD